MIQNILWIAFGGALGALARYGVSGVVYRYMGNGFPWGTAAVNITGSFFFGVIWAFALSRGGMSAEIRSVVLVGFLGSFTTFSTFISDTGQLMADSEMLFGLGNVLFQVIAGTVLFFLGLAAGRAI